ncbi:lipase family protein [Bradyrhizobium sp. 157]|uniref:lipase family protein n=1 Tax=Bradyrhizobium sp. 157 TaxID=2782631 RepID=UPI001FFAA3D1|nr:lipase family protein [Bradyrhizobium sp. 157]
MTYPPPPIKAAPPERPGWCELWTATTTGASGRAMDYGQGAVGELQMTDISFFEPEDLNNIPTFRAAYSDRTALLMAKLAYRAYNDFDLDDARFAAFSTELCKQGFVGCSALIDRDAGTAGYVVEGNDIIVVVFRGTEDELDWRTNVNARFVALQGGTRVHTGFFQAYWPIRDSMFEVVKRVIKAKPRPVYITGHSLGGALALMATAELANGDDATVRDCVAACYTFGCPRAGDASFDIYVKAPLYRITNGVDLVPAIPPAMLGYRHVGDTRYFGKIGVAPVRRSPNGAQKIWRTIGGMVAWVKTGRFQNIADHSMTVYVGKLDAWAKNNLKQTQDRREVTADPGISSRA